MPSLQPVFTLIVIALLTSWTLRIFDSRLVQAAACTPLPPDALHWWQAEGDAQDSIGESHGTLAGGTAFTLGMVGESFSFDGIDDLVEAPTEGFPTGSSDRTLEAWVKIDAHVAEEAFFAGYGAFGTSAATYHLGTSLGTLFFSSWNTALFGPTLALGQWYHVAVTNNGTAVTLYLNGVARAQGSLSLNTPTSTQFFIGKIAGPYGDIRRLQGQVDEVTLYSRALTSPEIAAIYQAGSEGKCPSAPPLPVNHAPTLAFSPEQGYLTDGTNPDKGTASLTPLTFKAVYTDDDNNPPQSLTLHTATDSTTLDPIPLVFAKDMPPPPHPQ